MRTYIRPIVCEKKNHCEYNLLFESIEGDMRGGGEIYIFVNTLRIPFVVFGIIDIELNIDVQYAPHGRRQDSCIEKIFFFKSFK